MKFENNSFASIYQEHSKMVFNLALHYVQNIHDAEDITQEVFVKIHQNITKFDSTVASLKTWICRIAINQSLDFIKTKKTQKRFAFITSLFNKESNEPVAEAADFNHPGVSMENKEALKTLFNFINQLPVNQKTAIILTKIEDRPQQEVAEIMETSIKAVESLLQRAKQNIEKKLTNSEGF
jgi:RNA polymerase sigma-70 factor, ECF subfamily